MPQDTPSPLSNLSKRTIMKRHFIQNLTLGVMAVGTMLASCTQDENLAVLSDRGNWQERYISVNVYRELPSTRTGVTDTEGDLDYTWSEGDQLLVTDQEGNKISTLVLNEEDAGKAYGNFSGYGELPNNQTLDLNFIYLGDGVATSNVETSYSFDIAEQTGALDALPATDIMSSTQSVTITDNAVWIEDFGLQKRLASAHYTLKFPEGVAMTNEAVTISGERIYNAASLSLANGQLNDSPTAGSITVTNGTGDFYIRVIPTTGYAPTFKVTIGGVEYTGTKESRDDFTAGKFLRASDGTGAVVEMTAPSVVDHTKNPLLKWAESDLQRSGSGTSVTGEFTGDYTQTGSYYQFGRNYGYASANEADNNYGVYVRELPSGRNAYPGTGSTSPVPTYSSSTDFSQYPEYFFIANGEYYPNSSSQTWEERAEAMGYTQGTPCPDGWRIPTTEDYQEIMPVIDGRTGNIGNRAWNTLVQIKELEDGTRCAFRWSEEDGNYYSYLKIECLVIDENTAEDAIDWDDENVVTRYFKGAGYLIGHVNEWELNSYGVITTHFTARPLEWGSYTGRVEVVGYGTAVVVVTQDYSLMNYGGFYWTSDANQNVFSLIFNSSTGYQLGYYLSTYNDNSTIAANIRCIKAEDGE